MPTNSSAFPELSIVIPVYNEDQSLPELLQSLASSLNNTNRSFEVILVNDGSTDSSARIIEEFISTNPAFSLLDLRKNNGKSAALSAGFKMAKGTIIVTLDADLQDDSADIPKLLEKIDSGFDMVCGWRKVRRDTVTKRIQSRLYNLFLSLLGMGVVHDMNCPLRCFRKEIVSEIAIYGEHHRLLPLLAKWQGFSVKEMIVNHRKRAYGKSKYTAKRAPSASLDILNALLIRSFYKNPGRLFGLIGSALSIIGLIICGYLAYIRITHGTIEWRYPLLILGVLLIALGAQSLLTGFLAELVVRTRIREKNTYSVKRVISHAESHKTADKKPNDESEKS
ncbi:MAG: glycosyltransferase family 2 protein [Planctomycetota bacterium]